MRAEYICGEDGWKTRWLCPSCNKQRRKNLNAYISLIDAICQNCVRRLLAPAPIWKVDANT